MNSWYFIIRPEARVRKCGSVPYGRWYAQKSRIKPNDTISLSSNPIPEMKKRFPRINHELTEKGANVIFQDTHVSRSMPVRKS